jgi:hypothetical protein
MKNLKSSTRLGFLTIAGIFFGLGIYNSVMINSADFLQTPHPRFVKRLDEMKGEVKVGRIVANQGMWVNLGDMKPAIQNMAKLPKRDMVRVAQSSSTGSNEVVDASSQAAINDDLELTVVEVFSAKKFPKTLQANEVSGSLKTQAGTLDSLSVQLPNNESISISSAEMVGNVFEYDSEGETLSGMIYEMGQGAYMVTLTNGPFEGTRMKFQAPKSEEVLAEEAQGREEAEQVSAEAPAPIMNDDGTQMEVGTFGATQPTQEVAQTETENVDQVIPDQNAEQTYGFDFNSAN